MPKALKKLQGTWRLVSVTANGRTTPMTSVYKLVVKGDKWEFNQPGGKSEVGVYKADDSGKVITLDIEITEGKRKGTKIPAVYEVKGKTLRICMDNSPRKERPAAVAARPNTLVETYQKLK